MTKVLYPTDLVDKAYFEICGGNGTSLNACGIRVASRWGGGIFNVSELSKYLLKLEVRESPWSEYDEKNPCRGSLVRQAFYKCWLMDHIIVKAAKRNNFSFIFAIDAYTKVGFGGFSAMPKVLKNIWFPSQEFFHWNSGHNFNDMQQVVYRPLYKNHNDTTLPYKGKTRCQLIETPPLTKIIPEEFLSTEHLSRVMGIIDSYEPPAV